MPEMLVLKPFPSSFVRRKNWLRCPSIDHIANPDFFHSSQVICVRKVQSRYGMLTKMVTHCELE